MWGTGSRDPRERQAPRLYSDLAIETSLTLKTVFGLPLRQTEGFVGSLLRMLGFNQLPIPDHSTLSRRAQFLDVLPRENPSNGPIHLIVDSSGLQIVGEGPLGCCRARYEGHARVAEAASGRR